MSWTGDVNENIIGAGLITRGHLRTWRWDEDDYDDDADDYDNKHDNATFYDDGCDDDDDDELWWWWMMIATMMMITTTTKLKMMILKYVAYNKGLYWA